MKARAAFTVVLVFAVVALSGARDRAAEPSLPRRLSDRAFWQMIVDFSEGDGNFPSDNVLSNERTYQHVIPELEKRRSPKGVYLGVGPDQNFTYITALMPPMAFIIDIRRQNMIEHLMYKALIEMSDNRVDFLSRLFSRPKPEKLARRASLSDIFNAFETVEPDEKLYRANMRAVEQRLIGRHGFALSMDDRRTLGYVYGAFYSEGPSLRFTFPRRTVATPWFPTYADLLMETDARDVAHSYLASEQSYRALREFERNNLLVPIVGDFGGGKAIRAVGRYLADRGATVNYFYTSNVEQYLFDNDAWQRYYANVATLPLDSNSTFIRSYFDAGFIYPPGIVTPELHSVQLIDPILSLLGAVRDGGIRAYRDVVSR